MVFGAMPGKKIKGRKRHIVTDTLGAGRPDPPRDRDGAPEVLTIRSLPPVRHLFADAALGRP